MSELPQMSTFKAVAGGQNRTSAGGRVQKVGVVDGAIGGAERFASLAALFPHVEFESVGPAWPERLGAPLDALIVQVDAGVADDVAAAVRRLKAQAGAPRVVIVLRDADVGVSRRLVREGAADVLPAPVNEPSLALSLERLFAADRPASEPEKRVGQVVAVLKAGGGVGATTLAVQAAALLARRGAGQVCVADLDLQFGAAALHFDLPDAVSVADCLAAGDGFDETSFDAALATHRSGARLLAAPRDLTPLEALAPAQIDSLVRGLRREFALSIVDLPTAWTAWTDRLLQLSDRIVLVTHLSVPHLHLVRRQLRVLEAQRLGATPLTLVCNSPSAEQQDSLSVKAAERTLGRPFDIVVPEDRRTAIAAINQGVELASVRRGTKAEKAIAELATVMAGSALVAQTARARP